VEIQYIAKAKIIEKVITTPKGNCGDLRNNPTIIFGGEKMP